MSPQHEELEKDIRRRAEAGDFAGATTAALQGYGPRYLHSIGQLFKGGPKTGLFVVLTAEPESDLPIPGSPFTFGQLETAQALGDFESLAAHGKPVLRLHMTGGAPKGLSVVDAAIERAIAAATGAGT